MLLLLRNIILKSFNNVSDKVKDLIFVYTLQRERERERDGEKKIRNSIKIGPLSPPTDSAYPDKWLMQS